MTLNGRFGAADVGSRNAADSPPPLPIALTIDDEAEGHRSRWPKVVAALLGLVLLAGAVGLGWWWARHGSAVVWQTQQAIEPGQELARSIAHVRVSDAPADAPGGDASISSLQARTALPAGTVLTSRNTTTGCAAVPTGQALVGVPAPAGFASVDGVAPGDAVQLVQVPPGNPGSAAPPPAPSAFLTTTVWAVRPVKDGGLVVTVLVPEDQAVTAVGLAARGELSMARIEGTAALAACDSG